MMSLNRRTLLRSAALSAASIPARKFLAQENVPVTKVYVVFKCHLDVGFTDTQANVVRKYFDVYFPKAIEIGKAQKDSDAPYRWTTGSWLVYEYLEQANAEQRKAMEDAIANKLLAWHALPFSWQTEMLSRSMIEGGISFSESLDKRFGVKTTGAKMTDVPGHTRGIVAPLVRHGVKFLDIGVNGASTSPDVPDLFLWQDTTGAQLAVGYHRMGYGGTIVVPGAGIAYSVRVRNDNKGPHTPDDIAKIYADLRKQFPGAEIVAASMTDVAEAVAPHTSGLPVVKEEIGDTWIHGLASDPAKLATFREVSRMRNKWLAEGRFSIGDDTDRAFLRRFLLGAEHTWGTDTKTYLDNDHYRPADLANAIQQPLPGYERMIQSWQEKQDDLRSGIGALPGLMQVAAMGAVEQLAAVQVSTDGMHGVRPGEIIDTPLYQISFDTRGAISKLMVKSTRREWATPAHPLALFTYQTLSPKNFSDFIASYIHSTEDWAYKDFGKPNIDHFGAQASEWHSQLRSLWTFNAKDGRRIVADLIMAPAPSTASAPVLLADIAPPLQMSLEMVIEDNGKISLTFTSMSKKANRMPEAMWLSFQPNVPAGLDGWVMDKANELVKPGEVIRGGNRTMHAVDEAVRWQGSEGTFILRTLDAPVIGWGKRTPLCFSRELPPVTEGFHVNLFNNAWGTNYPQWNSGDWRYRFTLELG